jgi:hypothetical protein
MVVLLPACKSKKPAVGHRIQCHCVYLTDFDDDAHVQVDVCARAGKDYVEEAKMCAMQAAHNYISKCDCKQPASKVCNPDLREACKAQ